MFFFAFSPTHPGPCSWSRGVPCSFPDETSHRYYPFWKPVPLPGTPFLSVLLTLAEDPLLREASLLARGPAVSRCDGLSGVPLHRLFHDYDGAVPSVRQWSSSRLVDASSFLQVFLSL